MDTKLQVRCSFVLFFCFIMTTDVSCTTIGFTLGQEVAIVYGVDLPQQQTQNGQLVNSVYQYYINFIAKQETLTGCAKYNK